MATKFASLTLGLLHLCAALPAITLQDLEVADDTMSVGSYIREVRAAAPQDYHKSYENEGDGEIGYSRKKSGGGKKGYQHFDSFHKKAGDHYEFEKQDSFGLDDEGQAGAHSHRHEQRERYREPHAKRSEEEDRYYEPRPGKKNREAEEYRIPEYERYVEDDSHEKKNKKAKEHKEDPHEITHEELKEGASDGNGGVEAHGHDPADYTLPEKYVYGSGENYNY